jgi:hypothetical protein
MQPPNDKKSNTRDRKFQTQFDRPKSDKSGGFTKPGKDFFAGAGN